MSTDHDQSRNGGGSVGVVLGGLIFSVVGVGMAYFAWSGAENARASESWPVVSGTVTESFVDVIEDSEGSDGHQPIVRYRYEVDGERYRSSRIAFGAHNNADKGSAERTVARYPVGEPADVAYDPDDHGRAVLEPGNEGVNFLIQLTGAGLAFVGLALLVGSAVAGIRRRTRPQQISGPDSSSGVSTDVTVHTYDGR